jgi:hypothetical protein
MYAYKTFQYSNPIHVCSHPVNEVLPNRTCDSCIGGYCHFKPPLPSRYMIPVVNPAPLRTATTTHSAKTALHSHFNLSYAQ